MEVEDVASPLRTLVAQSFRRRQSHFLILALSVASPSAALADVFPNNYDQRVADDSVQTFCNTSSMSLEEYKVVAEYAMYWLDATTDMSDSAQSCLNQTDVWWYSANLPAGTRGQRVCAVVSVIVPSICDRSNVSLDFVELDIGGNDWHDRRKTAVHELGHAIGLDHDTVSAMISGEVPGIDDVWKRYSSHDITHINAQY